MNITYKYAIMPTDEQCALIETNFSAARFVHNFYLKYITEHHEESGQYLSYFDCCYHLKELKQVPEYSFLQEADSTALASTIKRLTDAVWHHSRNPSLRMPTYKSDKACRISYTSLNAQNRIRVADNYIKLPKVGKVKIVLHRPMPEEYTIKTVTVVKDNKGRYSVSIVVECEYEKIPVPKIDPEKTIGLDYSMSKFFVDSNGNSPETDKLYQETEQRIQNSKSRLSAVKNGSKSYGKKQRRLMQLKAKIERQRNSYLNLLANQIADNYDCVCIEDLELSALHRRGYFAWSLANSSWSAFRKMLEYKLVERGKYFVKVGRHFPSSQLCSCCGYRNTALRDWRIRKWDCPSCGAHHDRDINAAINIRNEGMRILIDSEKR